MLGDETGPLSLSVLRSISLEEYGLDAICETAMRRFDDLYAELRRQKADRNIFDVCMIIRPLTGELLY